MVGLEVASAASHIFIPSGSVRQADRITTAGFAAAISLANRSISLLPSNRID